MGIGAALLYLAFQGIDLAAMWKSLTEANYWWVGLSMLMGYAAFISRGVRWVLLIDSLGYTVKTRNAVAGVTVGYMANLAIPRIGELTRCTSLNQVEDVPVDKLFGTIILERTIDFGLLLILIASCFVLQYDLINQFFHEALAMDKGEDASSLTYLIFAIPLLGFLGLFLFRKTLKKLPLYDKVVQFLKGLKDGFQSIKHIRKPFWFWFHTAFIWFMYFAMTFVCVFSLPETAHLGASAGLLLMVVGGLGMVVPAQGGVGSYHFAIILGMAALGIPQESGIGLTYATLVHAGQTLMILFTGAIALVLLYLARRKKAQHEITSSQN